MKRTIFLILIISLLLGFVAAVDEEVEVIITPNKIVLKSIRGVNGGEVPMDTMVRAMMRSEMPMAVAMLTAPVTMSFPPATNPAKPIIINNTAIGRV